jgi:hypothetical protein
MSSFSCMSNGRLWRLAAVHGRLHALLIAGRLTGHAVNAVVSVVDFANGGRA